METKQLFRCEAAGRSNNEDNGQILSLGENGILMIVCDGMGGTEAGEVASELAVNTIKEIFSTVLPESALADPCQYLKDAILYADEQIKNYQQAHAEARDMGSTIVLTWLLGQKAHVAWCGDSRAYRYNKSLGLERLSHDHSLVQSWVDAGAITEEQAFTHPQSNIITHSLGDPNGPALPDATTVEAYNGDIFLLCTDGLCGLLRDSEIESTFKQSNSIETLCASLWQEAEAAHWHDNMTTALVQVQSGANELAVTFAEPVSPEVTPLEDAPISSAPYTEKPVASSNKNNILYMIIGALIAAIIILGALWFFDGKKKDEAKPAQTEQIEQKIPAKHTVPERHNLQQPSQETMDQEDNEDKEEIKDTQEEEKEKEEEK